MWSFGEGGNFYIDATQEKYSKYFNMYSYITKELPEIVSQHFPIDINRQSISGYSMGGMGAFIAYIKNPDIYRSLSVFAPLCCGAKSSYATNAYKEYLGSIEAGKAYDPTELIRNFKDPKNRPILYD